MIQMQLISSIIELERRLTFQEDRLINRRFEPYVNYLAAPQLHQNEIHQDENKAPADFIRALNTNL